MSQIHPDLMTASWHNPPATLDWDADGLLFKTGNKTDFWQRTWYGFQRDDGHFLGVEAPTDFSATLVFDGKYEELYDQAGIMIRSDENNWIKAGIEYSDGITNLSAVVTTQGQSDWSIIAAPSLDGEQIIRLTRVKDTVFIHYQSSDTIWQIMRLCSFKAKDAKVGPMACSPERSGFSVRISHFDITPPVENPLH